MWIRIQDAMAIPKNDALLASIRTVVDCLSGIYALDTDDAMCNLAYDGIDIMVSQDNITWAIVATLSDIYMFDQFEALVNISKHAADIRRINEHTIGQIMDTLQRYAGV